MAKALKLDPVRMGIVEISALLHDIGKLGISDDILNKPSQLSAEEWEAVKSHPRLGAEFAKRVPQFEACTEGILHHHEWYDGTGYPDGLKGEQIPLESRILAIADSFAAMTSERSYSDTITYEQALEQLKRCAGSQFDPGLVDIFVSTFESNVNASRKKARR